MTMTGQQNAVRQELEAAIHRQCAQFAAHYADGDIDGLVDTYYTTTPRLVAPDLPFLEGRSAIKDMFRNMRESGITQISLEPIHFSVDEVLGYEVGRAQLFADGDDNSVVQNARYVVAWRKCTDGWRVEADMFAMGEI